MRLLILAVYVLAALAVTTAQLCGRENCGTECRIPSMPTFAELNNNTLMPDPFVMMSGSSISSVAEWTCRRAEIAAQFEWWELGAKPSKPPIVTGSVQQNIITVTAGNDTNTITFTAAVSLPTNFSAPYAAIIALGGNNLGTPLLQSMGVAIITLNNGNIALQQNYSSRGIGKFYDVYGKDHTAGAMMAWAWAVSRIIDVIEDDNNKLFNVKQIGVTGCSRNGKGALVAGAFDERIALVIPQESGSGGSAGWRISDWQGPKVQRLQQITYENVWFTFLFNRFNFAASFLPFDHHMLQAMVAPRGLLVIENTSMEWLGDISCWASSLAGRMIYQALGLADSMGITQVGGHPHCQLPVSQQPDVRAFVNRFLLNNNANVNTTIVYSDGNYTFNLANWINWKIPNFTPQPSTTDDSWSLTSIIIFVVLALPPILIGAAIFYYVRCGARSSRNSNASTNNASLLDDSSAYTLASDAETNNK